MVHSFSSSILYGLFQYVASKFPPKLVPGGQERALVALVILNFAPRRTFRGRAEFRRGDDQPERPLQGLLQPWVLMLAKI